MRWIAVLALTICPAFAECPPAPDIAEAEGLLLEAARAAPSEEAARGISSKLWALWAAAPDAKAQALLDRGMAARRKWDFVTSLAAFDALVAYCPHYAEGYNQRAFVYFLSAEYERALADLDLAIARSPRHVAAISGKALTLMGLERMDEAQEVLRHALSLNPWIPERAYLRGEAL